MNLRLLAYAKRIRALAHNGLHFAESAYDLERYEELEQIAFEMIEGLTEHTVDDLRGAFKAEEGYATPKVDVRAAVIREGKILLVKEKADGLWALPGGWADVGFTPKEVAVKETQEEAGLEVEAERLYFVHDKKYRDFPPDVHHVYKIFIGCRPLGEQVASGHETEDAAWFSADELPPLSLPRNIPEQVRLCFAYYAEPSRLPELD